MRSRRSRLTLLVLAGLLVTAGACGGDDDDSNDEESSDDTTTTEPEEETSTSGGDGGAADEEAYVAAIVESMEASEDGGFGDAATNECVAGVYVDIIGLENLQAAVTPEELVASPDSDPEDFGLPFDPGALFVGLRNCIEIDTLILSDFSGGDPAITECMLNATTDEQRQALFVAYYNEQVEPDPAVLAPIEAAASQCGAPPPS